MSKTYDVVIIGGGFFGLSIAEYIRSKWRQKDVIVLEKETDFMQRASYNNQARVHGGYHYPRSFLTALRSQVNFPTFASQYEKAVVSDFDKYYAVARTFSKVSARQFHLFSKRIGAEISQAPVEVKSLFNERMIENVFRVREYAFDARLLKELLVNRLTELNVRLEVGCQVQSVHKDPRGIRVEMADGSTIVAKKVYNCTYSLLNKLNIASGFPLLPLKHELAEICLVTLPKQLRSLGVTVMCGPFFSFMPFPDRELHSLSHVRYTPHSEWQDTASKYRDGHAYLNNEVSRHSHYPHMIADAKRYIPALHNAEYKDSLWEIKTILQQSEHDDSRPILFKHDYILDGYTCVLGGKLDNIYDAYRELDLIYGA